MLTVERRGCRPRSDHAVDGGLPDGLACPTSATAAPAAEGHTPPRGTSNARPLCGRGCLRRSAFASRLEASRKLLDKLIRLVAGGAAVADADDLSAALKVERMSLSAMGTMRPCASSRATLTTATSSPSTRCWISHQLDGSGAPVVSALSSNTTLHPDTRAPQACRARISPSIRRVNSASPACDRGSCR